MYFADKSKAKYKHHLKNSIASSPVATSKLYSLTYHHNTLISTPTFDYHVKSFLFSPLRSVKGLCVSFTYRTFTKKTAAQFENEYNHSVSKHHQSLLGFLHHTKTEARENVLL